MVHPGRPRMCLAGARALWCAAQTSAFSLEQEHCGTPREFPCLTGERITVLLPCRGLLPSEMKYSTVLTLCATSCALPSQVSLQQESTVTQPRARQPHSSRSSVVHRTHSCAWVCSLRRVLCVCVPLLPCNKGTLILPSSRRDATLHCDPTLQGGVPLVLRVRTDRRRQRQEAQKAEPQSEAERCHDGTRRGSWRCIPLLAPPFQEAPLSSAGPLGRFLPRSLRRPVSSFLSHLPLSRPHLSILSPTSPNLSSHLPHSPSSLAVLSPLTRR